MDIVDTGQLTLEALPDGKSEEAIVAYLAKFFKSVSRERLVGLVKKTPVVLSTNVSAATAKRIIAELERLGATALYIPKGLQEIRPREEEKSAADLGMPVLQAFQGDLPRVPVSTLYNLGLTLVAFAMLLLPLIYLGLITGVAYLLYYHATESIELLHRLSSVTMALFTCLAPVVVGILLILFMIKPLFVRRAHYLRPSKIERQDEPLLFAFVQKLCSRLGAPLPSEIHLDINVNASASFRRGLLSIFANDLVLTIGLPLAAGLNLHQFAGVLAHEFGHFAQTTGMRVTYIIRSINLWFERVVYEEDEWDERIRRWSRDWDFRIGVVLLVARLFIWVTRQTLWILMLFGHVISSFMLRQMEYDADRYETHLVGAEVFESTAQRMVELSLAHEWAFQDLGSAWEEGRLVDNLPALILANERHIPDHVRQRALRAHLRDARTGLFHTHPCDRDRITSARKLQAQPLFKLDISHAKIQSHIEEAKARGRENVFTSSPPASILFKDFGARAHRVSLDYYRGVFGKEIMSKNLVSVEAMLKSHDEEWEYSRALSRFFQGQFTVLRPLGLSQNCMQATVDYQKIPPMLGSARKLIISSAGDYDQKLQNFNRLEIRIMEAFQNRALLDAGLHLSTSQVKAMETVFQEVEEGQRLAVIDELNYFEKLVRHRMTGALQLLNVQSVAAKITKGEEPKKTAERFIKTAHALENQMATVRDLQIAYQQLAVLTNQLAGKEDDEKLVRQVRVKMEDLRQTLARLRRLLSEISYPFEHTKDQMTLGEFAILKVPAKDELGPLLDGAYEAVDRLFRVYARLVGRLTYLAEMVESGLGLSPLPEPPPPPN
ncbi:MAG: M48 family metallopeptidase [Deltaproteobacteria bacterium]|nr:M48 family metallopeptidase [Deltaproteobacteria bacterium]